MRSQRTACVLTSRLCLLRKIILLLSLVDSFVQFTDLLGCLFYGFKMNLRYLIHSILVHTLFCNFWIMIGTSRQLSTAQINHLALLRCVGHQIIKSLLFVGLIKLYIPQAFSFTKLILCRYPFLMIMVFAKTNFLPSQLILRYLFNCGIESLFLFKHLVLQIPSSIH